MPLNDTMLRNLKSDGTPKKLADSEGLYLCLSASGGKLWRLGFGKEEMTIHSFRAMFSTILNEKKLEWGFDGDIVEPSLPTRSKIPFGMPKKPCVLSAEAA